MWDISIHGDMLEIKAANYIRNKIPAYEETWKRYIGHQGRGIMAEMTNITPEQDLQRRNFSELHYTILESMFQMNKISERQNMKQINSFETYTEILDQLMLYQAYAGRIRDNVIEAFTVLGKKDLATSAQEALDKVYSERHVFVHRRKVPFSLDEDQLFLTAMPKSSSTATIGFGKNMLWSDVTKDDLIHLDDYFEKSVEELTQVVNTQLNLMCEAIKTIIKSNNLILTDPVQSTGVSGYSGYSISLSGISSSNSTCAGASSF